MTFPTVSSSFSDGRRDADGDALFLLERDQRRQVIEFVGVIGILREPLVHQDGNGGLAGQRAARIRR